MARPWSHDPKLRRAVSVAELREIGARMATSEGVRRAGAFRPRPSDILIATYPKSGTTWMQQIVHGLRTGGAMDFDSITAVVPWIEMAYDMDIDLDADQVAEPRAYTTHYPWRRVPKPGRYVCVVRDPKDVVVSFYHFYEGWWFEPGSIPLDVFVREFFAPRTWGGHYWDHLVSWGECRARPDTLFLCYEDLAADLHGAVARVAAFIGLDAGSDAVEIATRQATRAFMSRHAGRFDEHLLRAARDADCGLPPGGDSAKVRPGDAPRAALGEPESDLLDEIWRREVGRRLGFPTYEALRAALAGT